jgi:hypothetical protein
MPNVKKTTPSGAIYSFTLWGGRLSCVNYIIILACKQVVFPKYSPNMELP